MKTFYTYPTNETITDRVLEHARALEDIRGAVDYMTAQTVLEAYARQCRANCYARVMADHILPAFHKLLTAPRGERITADAFSVITDTLTGLPAISFNHDGDNITDARRTPCGRFQFAGGDTEAAAYYCLSLEQLQIIADANIAARED